MGLITRSVMPTRCCVDPTASRRQNDSMRVLRQKLRIASTWLTAATFLVTAVPHFRCVCPNGHVKPFCLSVLSQTTGCCCGGACCPANQGGRCCCQPGGDGLPSAGAEGGGCCAEGPPLRPRPAEGTDSHLRGTSCHKTPAVEELLAPAPERLAGQDWAGPGLVLPPADTAAFSPFVPRQLSWQSYQLPPPTDLVITLQHLLV